jgi:gamma-glutamylaminecyclotransferase
MTARVFVYGTLKAGFPNFHVNTGVRVPGDFVTVERFPLYVIGDIHVPWLVNRPGEGEFVCGQVFEVDADTLAGMDVLEQIDEPGWYSRAEIAVRPRAEPAVAPLRVFVYFGDAERLTREPVHLGPLAEYTLAHARSYRNT